MSAELATVLVAALTLLGGESVRQWVQYLTHRRRGVATVEPSTDPTPPRYWAAIRYIRQLRRAWHARHPSDYIPTIPPALIDDLDLGDTT